MSDKIPSEIKEKIDRLNKLVEDTTYENTALRRRIYNQSKTIDEKDEEIAWRIKNQFELEKRFASTIAAREAEKERLRNELYLIFDKDKP